MASGRLRGEKDDDVEPGWFLLEILHHQGEYRPGVRLLAGGRHNFRADRAAARGNDRAGPHTGP